MSSVVDSNASSSLDNYIGPAVGAYAVGQSFTGNGLILDYATLYCHQDSSPDGTITAKIYAHTGTFGSSSNKTGAALATSDTFNCSSLSGSFADQQFTFSGANRITLVNTTKYVVLFETSGMSTGLIYHRSSFSNPHAGNLVYDYGADGSQDLTFAVYGSPLAGQVPYTRPRQMQPLLAQ